ncbi:hypothetical protein ACLRGF_12005 [Mycetocola zhadangensis]|jgi:hypothetical protein|uniref:hypothetical protein n=1 Tax=Mycetocola zhadangensis TaxID=1164595 RepID=UPI003A4E54A4
MFSPRRHFAVSGVLGVLLVGAGVVGLSGAALAAPAASQVSSVTFAHSCVLQRVGDQLVKCDNLTGAGVRAPAFVSQVIHTPVAGIQRMGLAGQR